MPPLPFPPHFTSTNTVSFPAPAPLPPLPPSSTLSLPTPPILPPPYLLPQPSPHPSDYPYPSPPPRLPYHRVNSFSQAPSRATLSPLLLFSPPHPPRPSPSPFPRSSSSLSHTSRTSLTTLTTLPLPSQSSLPPYSLVALTCLRSTSVGLCALIDDSATLLLCQITDTLSFCHSLSALSFLHPHTVLYPATLQSTPLILWLTQRLSHSGSRAFPVDRSFFNENVGRDLLASHCNEESLRSLALDASHFLCVSAAGALLRWRRERGEVYYPQSMRVTYKTAQKVMHIDVHSAEALELVAARAPSTSSSSSSTARPGPAPTSHASKRTPRTLFDVLNHTRTTAGARMLRSTLLQPFSARPPIEARLNAVEELLAMQAQLSSISALLADLNLFDSVMTQTLVRVHAVASLDPTQQRCTLLTHILHMRRWTDTMTRLASTLAECRSPLLVGVASRLSDNRCREISAAISEVLDEGSVCRQGGDLVSLRNVLVYAVKTERDGYLDTARRVYLDALEDVNREVERVNRLSRVLRPPAEAKREEGGEGRSRGKKEVARECKMVFTLARGYHLQVPTWLCDAHRNRCAEMSVASPVTGADSEQSRVDCVNLQLVVKKGKWATASTWRLHHASNRQQGAFAEILRRSSEHFTGLLTLLRSRYLPFLLLCCDEIALLDLLLSFVRTITTSTFRYTRPTLTISSATTLTACSHPLLHALLPPLSYVPNSVYFSPHANLSVLTGANGGGKSSYLRMVGVATVMAGIGCYVPCQRATVRMCEELVCRGAGEAAALGPRAGEESSSALWRELKYVAHILHSCQRRSVVLLDEVGRSTSSLAGLSLAWAIAEQLASHPQTYSILATHHTQLTSLAHLYPHIHNLHTSITLSPVPHPTASTPSIHYLYTVKDGAFASHIHYGIDVAAQCGWGAEVITEAREVGRRLRERRDGGRGEGGGGLVERTAEKLRVWRCVVQELLMLKEAKASTEHVRRVLIRIRDEYYGVGKRAELGEGGDEERMVVELQGGEGERGNEGDEREVRQGGGREESWAMSAETEGKYDEGREEVKAQAEEEMMAVEEERKGRGGAVEVEDGVVSTGMELMAHMEAEEREDEELKAVEPETSSPYIGSGPPASPLHPSPSHLFPSVRRSDVHPLGPHRA